MRHSIWYSLNPSGGMYCFTEDAINVSLASVEWSIAYVFEHVFDWPRLILRWSIVASGVGWLFEQRVADVRTLYWIVPSRVFKHGFETYAVYRYSVAASESEHSSVKYVLEYLFKDHTIQDMYPKDGEDISKDDKETTVNPKDITGLTPVIYPKYESFGLSGANLHQISVADETVKMKDLMKHFDTLQENDIDEASNLHVVDGRVFMYVLRKLENMNQAMNFFNDTFKLEFQTRDNSATIERAGIRINEFGTISAGSTGYISIDNKGVTKQITDFFIDVHYSIQTEEGRSYVVTITNEKRKEVARKIIWPNTASKNRLSEALQALGNFHFTGSDRDVPWLHTAIATKYPPIVKNIVGYGIHRDEWVIIFQNGVYDISGNIFSEKHEDEDGIYFSGDGRWFRIVDAVGNPIKDTVSIYVPKIKSQNADRTIPEIMKWLDGIYNDNTGRMLSIVAMSMLGYMLFCENQDTHPMIFIRGVTGSGKSTFNQILKKMLGIDENNSQSYRSTKFALSNTICNMNKLPLFISEFREWKWAEDPKSSMFRNVFDRTLDTKGRSNLTVITYNYVAVPVFDAEECFMDGALRSRCIQYQIKRSSRWSKDAAKIIRNWNPDDFMYSYMTRASKERYHNAYEAAAKIFHLPNIDPRIFNNIRRMYAGVMAAAPEMEEWVIEMLIDVAKFNQEDFMENGTSQDIIKAISRYLGSFRSKGYCDFAHAFIPWNDIVEYINRNRVVLALGWPESYIEHLQELGMEVEFKEIDTEWVWEKIFIQVVAIPLSIIPKQLLAHPTIYAGYKKFKAAEFDRG